MTLPEFLKSLFCFLCIAGSAIIIPTLKFFMKLCFRHLRRINVCRRLRYSNRKGDAPNQNNLI